MVVGLFLSLYTTYTLAAGGMALTGVWGNLLCFFGEVFFGALVLVFGRGL